jgi:predicted kinase
LPTSPYTPILIVTGPPGVGKTTTARIVADRSPRAVHLETDAFFGFIRTGYVEPWRPDSHEQNRVVMRIVAEAAAGYAAAGYRTIVDGIVIPEWFLEPLRDAFHEAGCQVAYAVLRAPLATCLARVQDREGAPPIEAGAIEQLWESFTGLAHLEVNVLEVGDRSADEAADMLERHLAVGGLNV